MCFCKIFWVTKIFLFILTRNTSAWHAVMSCCCMLCVQGWGLLASLIIYVQKNGVHVKIIWNMKARSLKRMRCGAKTHCFIKSSTDTVEQRQTLEQKTIFLVHSQATPFIAKKRKKGTTIFCIPSKIWCSELGWALFAIILPWWYVHSGFIKKLIIQSVQPIFWTTKHTWSYLDDHIKRLLTASARIVDRALLEGHPSSFKLRCVCTGLEWHKQLGFLAPSLSFTLKSTLGYFCMWAA